jgi:hypothetical protein
MDFEPLTAADPAAVGTYPVNAFAVVCFVQGPRRRAPMRRSRLGAIDGGPDRDA